MFYNSVCQSSAWHYVNTWKITYRPATLLNTDVKPIYCRKIYLHYHRLHASVTKPTPTSSITIIIHCRAKVGGHYELLAANTLSVPIVGFCSVLPHCSFYTMGLGRLWASWKIMFVNPRIYRIILAVNQYRVQIINIWNTPAITRRHNLPSYLLVWCQH